MADYLIDTQALIWILNDDPRLTTHARSILENPQNRLQALISSYWEIAIKANLGKLNYGKGSIRGLMDESSKFGIEILGIMPDAISTLETLQRFHGDPFDRILIAHAMLFNMPVVTSDSQFDFYEVTRIWN